MLFFDDVFQRAVLKAEVGKHLFKTTILALRIFHFFNISGFHPAIFSLPVVIAGFRNPGLARLILNGSTSLDGLQNGDDLVLSESDFSRGDLLRGYNQYVGRSLKVNGPFCRDAYKTTSFSRQYQISSFFLRSAYIKNTLHISTACLSIIMVLCHKLVIAYDFFSCLGK
ncbi:hypothetical protein ACVW06_003620 [Pantoea ananatis]